MDNSPTMRDSSPSQPSPPMWTTLWITMWMGCGQPVEKYLYLQAIHMCIQLYPQPPVEATAAPEQRKMGLSTYPQVSTIYYLDISPLVS